MVDERAPLGARFFHVAGEEDMTRPAPTVCHIERGASPVLQRADGKAPTEKSARLTGGLAHGLQTRGMLILSRIRD
jgi:hypothetical protein